MRWAHCATLWWGWGSNISCPEAHISSILLLLLRPELQNVSKLANSKLAKLWRCDGVVILHHGSSLSSVSSVARVTSIKSSVSIITHQSHISKVKLSGFFWIIFKVFLLGNGSSSLIIHHRDITPLCSALDRGVVAATKPLVPPHSTLQTNVRWSDKYIVGILCPS